MEVIEVDATSYDAQVQAVTLFNTGSFANLNASKVEEVFYLLFKDSKVRLGLIVGRNGQNGLSPFSAPYGGFSFNDGDCKAKIIDEAISALTNWFHKKQLERLTVALPPMHYEPQLYTRVVNGLRNNDFQISHIDVNHHFEIPKGNFEEEYPSLLQRNARKNLNNSLKQELSFIPLALVDAQRAYQIIAINRAAKQKPLRMSLEQICEMSQITNVDFFVVNHKGTDVAAAIVFQIDAQIGHVVYWGDDPAFFELRAMNFLTFHLFKYYAVLGFHTLDIGISTEHSFPNYGLCEFKESIGCKVSLKYSFEKIAS
jgi:hypothetical protein